MSFPPPDPARDAAVHGAQPTMPADPNHTVRPGDITPQWRVMLTLSWMTAFFAYAGVWQASVQIGIGTWWVGPRAQPTFIVVRLLPFLLSLVVGLLIIYNVRRVLRWSAAGVAAAALISIPDFSRSTGLGIAEAVIAGLLGLVTLASLAGRYRSLKPEPAPAVAPDPASR